MEFKLSTSELTTLRGDLVVIGCFDAALQSGKQAADIKLEKGDEGAAFDRLFEGELLRTLRTERFKGKEGESRLLFSAGKIPARYLLAVGLGEKKDLSVGTLKRVGAVIAREAKGIKAHSIGCVIQRESIAGLSPQKRTQALVEGMILGSYQFNRYRGDRKELDSSLKEVHLLTTIPAKALEQAIQTGKAIGESTCFARDLCNTPSNDLTPMKLAREAEAMAKREGLTFRLLEKKDLQREKMGAFLAIAQGADEPPVLIHVSYRPKGKPTTNVALVGKAVTFDTGGISLKPPKDMREMKCDMGGGAVVLSTMQAIARIKPQVAVDAYIPSSENMPDAKAIKPGDIVRARNGKTIEIISTDAEGRMLLADTLSYASERKPDYMIDLATLTGGAVYALGEIYACLVGNDQQLVDRLLKASKETSEYAWQLPLEKQYLKGLTKGPADLVNAGGGGAQTITAALFLSQFVDETKWAHFDIAACAWTNEETPLSTKGGTGAMVPTLVQFISSL